MFHETLILTESLSEIVALFLLTRFIARVDQHIVLMNERRSSTRSLVNVDDIVVNLLVRQPVD